MRITWQLWQLRHQAARWLKSIHKKTSARTPERSAWWPFIFSWHKRVGQCLEDFTLGRYLFSPMTQFTFKDDTVRSWYYPDRLMIKLILLIIKSTFKHIISRHCYHLEGPNGVKTAIHAITNTLALPGHARECEYPEKI